MTSIEVEIELPVDDSKFAGVNRRTVKTILLILGPATSTILLLDLRSTPGFSPPSGSQLRIHSAYHNLGAEEIRFIVFWLHSIGPEFGGSVLKRRNSDTNHLIRVGTDCPAVCNGDGSLTGADKMRGTGYCREHIA